MKKFLMFLVLGVFVVSLINCGGGQQGTTSNQDIPDWFLNPPKAEDAIYGVGSAKKASQSLAKSAADARAREEIARAIEVKVQTMFKNFQQESGIGENAQALEFVQNVSKQIANATLTGTQIEKRYAAKDGTIYTLMSYSMSEVKKQAKEKMKTNIHNEEALYNEFKAKQAFDALDTEIDKMSGKEDY